MTLKGGTSQACAACKYQRRRCTSTCQLAPYFPADQPNMFQNAHRLFGVRNMLKILEQLDSSQKAIAMKSIIYQANAREKYPVYGCLGIIHHLCYQIQLVEEEIQAVHAQLAIYKQQNEQQAPSNIHDSLSQLQLGMAPPRNNSEGFFHQEQLDALRIGGSDEASYSDNVTCFLDAKENNTVNSMWLQHSYNDNCSPLMMQSQLISSQPSSIQQEEGIQDYDEMHQFFDTIDDKQSYIDSKQVYESSSESSLKDTIQSIEHVGEKELKSAAACFSLTSAN